MSETNGVSAPDRPHTFVHVRIPPQTAVLLDAWCDQNDRSKNYAVRTILHAWLTTHLTDCDSNSATVITGGVKA